MKFVFIYGWFALYVYIALSSCIVHMHEVNILQALIDLFNYLFLSKKFTNLEYSSGETWLKNSYNVDIALTLLSISPQKSCVY